MTERKLHSDFEAADEPHRWQGKLSELGKRLRDTAWKLRGEWAWVILPNGALVAMRIREEEFKKELRIARREAPTTEKGWAAWHREVETFQKHLDCEEWPITRVSGKAEAFLLEPVALSDAQKRKADDFEPCAGGCGQQIKKSVLYAVNRCTQCAMESGKAEAERMNRERDSKQENLI